MKSIFTVESERLTFLCYGAYTGNAPDYWLPTDLFKRAEEIAKIFNDDGSFNPSYGKAEEYALCLAHEGKHDAARQLFQLIVGDSADVLSVLDTETDKFPMVANTPGKLGCEGLFVYAGLLRECGELELAGKYFREIVDKKIEGAGIRGGDILAESARYVLVLCAYPPEKGSEYRDKFNTAKKGQY